MQSPLSRFHFLSNYYNFHFFLPIQKHFFLRGRSSRASSEIGSDFASINSQRMVACNFKKTANIFLTFAVNMLTSVFFFFCSVIPIFSLKTTSLRNEGPLADRSQKSKTLPLEAIFIKLHGSIKAGK